MWSDYEVRLVGAKGERNLALEALRATARLPLGELIAWLTNGAASGPRVVFKRAMEEAQSFARRYGEVLDLELWTAGQRDRAAEPLLGPYEPERVVVDRPVVAAGVRFAVDDVVPASERLPTEDAGLTWMRLIEGELMHHETPHELVVTKAPHAHPFAHSVQCAFDEHRPLRISPDSVWLTSTHAPLRTTSGQSFELLGGLAGVAQDEAGWLQAVSGWAVVERPFSQLLDRLERHRDASPQVSPCSVDVTGSQPDWRRRHLPCPAALVELSDRLRSFALHSGRWKFLEPNERTRHPVAQGVEGSIQLMSEFVVFAELHDGRQACYRSVRLLQIAGAEPDWWVVILRSDEVATRDTPVVAKGIRQFFERVLDEGDQPVFDASDFVPESTLAEGNRW